MSRESKKPRIFITGHTNGGFDGNSNLGNYDFFIVKYNSSGVKQ